MTPPRTARWTPADIEALLAQPFMALVQRGRLARLDLATTSEATA